ncbi:MAG: FtsQ-type POTRA domain-containing protein [Actinomycetota bacterium]|nr:FtsQ-type POTRA domain-containing protein [Actinomycetota bacterium]
MSPRPRSSRSRFASRARARRWALLRRALVGLVLVGMVAGAGWLVFFSSVLAVERVEVTGVRTVPADRVAAAAAVPVGGPLARVDVDRVRRRVEQVGVVARADIGRAWPHTLTIDVTERTPVAAVRSPRGFRLVDAGGVMYRTVAQAPKRLPVMTVGSQPGAREEAAAVVASLPRSLERRVRAVEAATMDSIELWLRGGRTVVWGSAESSALKAEVLAALLQRRSQAASVYDVSVPGAPTLDVG